MSSFLYRFLSSAPILYSFLGKCNVNIFVCHAFTSDQLTTIHKSSMINRLQTGRKVIIPTLTPRQRKKEFLLNGPTSFRCSSTIDIVEYDDSVEENERNYEVVPTESLDLPIILNCPVGEATPDMIKDALESMSYYSSKCRWSGGRKSHQSSSPRKNAQLVEDVLNRLIKEQLYSHQTNCIINTQIFNIAIEAWANLGLRGSAQKAENILLQLIQHYNSALQNGNDNLSFSLRPDVFSFTKCFQAWYCLHLLNNNEKESKAQLRKANAILQLSKESLSGKSHGIGIAQLKENGELNKDFVFVLNEWSRSSVALFESSKMCEHFLEFLENSSKEEDYKFMLPTTRTFNSVINSLAKNKNIRRNDSTERAELIVRRMGDASNTLTYTSLISCWSNSGKHNSARRAREILAQMEDVYYENNKGDNVTNNSVLPDTIAYNAVLNAYSKSSDPSSCDDAMNLLKDMENRMTLAKPDIRSYNLVLGCLARRKSAQDAENLLRKIEKNYNTGVTKIRPNNISFTICIDAWANSGNGDRATKVLDWMAKSHRDGNADAQPSSRCFESVLAAWSKSGRGKNAGQRAEEVYNYMEQMQQEGNKNIVPTTRTYNAVINALSISRFKGKKFAEKAEEILSKMEALNESGHRNVAPDVYTYSSVMKVWSKSGDKEGGQRAEALLKKMENAGIEPNSHHFNAAIAAFGRSNSKNAAQKAEALLNQMDALYTQGNKNMKPNSFSFTIVIDSWAKSGERGSAQRAEILLKLMELMYQKGNTSAKPNVHVYTTVINCWAKSGEESAGEHADKLLQRMEKLYEKGNKDIKPNTYTYTAVIDAHIKSGRRGAEDHADRILKHMEKLHADGDLSVKPNTKTYNTVINAWAKSGQLLSAQKAESILKRLESFSESGVEDIKPTVVSYTSVINAWAFSSSSGKSLKAWNLLRKMDQMYKDGNKNVKPNVVAYSSVINACALSKGDSKEKDSAMQIAYKTFKELEESSYGFPNHVTYSNFLKASSRLISDEIKREKVLKTVFIKCCNDGQVNVAAITQLRNALTDTTFSTFMGDLKKDDMYGMSNARIPSHWSRNVDNSRNYK